MRQDHRDDVSVTKTGTQFLRRSAGRSGGIPRYCRSLRCQDVGSDICSAANVCYRTHLILSYYLTERRGHPERAKALQKEVKAVHCCPRWSPQMQAVV